MAQIMLAVGIDTRDNPVNLYTGEDFNAALALRARRAPSVSDTSSKIGQGVTLD
jgi:hypothetical protein